MLVDTEWAQRKERRLKSRIKKANFRENALTEDMDLSPERGSTIFATQLPVSEWHSRFEDPTLADAIMDRVVHNAYRLELKGERKRQKT